MANAKIMPIEDVPLVDRGDGVATTLLVGTERVGKTSFTSGLTRFPPGRAAPVHSHNCDEMVILLEGEGVVEVDGMSKRLSRYDTTFIPADKPHRFNNVGASDLLILWVYGADHVTRTFTESGKTVAHLSSGDKVTVT